MTTLDPHIKSLMDNAMTKYKGTARLLTNIKPMDGSPTVAQLQPGWYVYGEKSTTGSDLINITAYYKGSEAAKASLSKICKVSITNLTLLEIVLPPPVNPPSVDEYVRAVLIKADGTADEYLMDKQ